MAIDSGYWGNGAALDSGYWESSEDEKVATNADHIRSMTDEELINMVTCPMGFSMFRCTVPMPCGDSNVNGSNSLTRRTHDTV